MIEFRCSQLGKIMSNGRDKKSMGDTAKTYLQEVWAEEIHGRRELITSKYMEKGNSCEEDSLTILSEVNNTLYTKYKGGVLSNGFIKGTPDITPVNEIIDVKSKWNLQTFTKARIANKIEKDYEWQLRGYMWLNDVTKATLVYCLVNATPKLIDDEKRKMLYALNCSETDEEYIEACIQIEINMIYDMAEFKKLYDWYILEVDNIDWKYDIPKKERVHTIKIEYDYEKIELLKIRVLEAREYIKSLD